jgi:hypothetical protein
LEKMRNDKVLSKQASERVSVVKQDLELITCVDYWLTNGLIPLDYDECHPNNYIFTNNSNAMIEYMRSNNRSKYKNLERIEIYPDDVIKNLEKEDEDGAKRMAEAADDTKNDAYDIALIKNVINEKRYTAIEVDITANDIAKIIADTDNDYISIDGEYLDIESISSDEKIRQKVMLTRMFNNMTKKRSSDSDPNQRQVRPRVSHDSMMDDDSQRSMDQSLPATPSGDVDDDIRNALGGGHEEEEENEVDDFIDDDVDRGEDPAAGYSDSEFADL